MILYNHCDVKVESPSIYASFQKYPDQKILDLKNTRGGELERGGEVDSNTPDDKKLNIFL